MSNEREIKDFCPVTKQYVKVSDTRPYASQVKTVAPKLQDGFMELYCDKHCYEGRNTPEGCLYKDITDNQPPIPGNLVEWISKTECVIKTDNPVSGGFLFSHQILKSVAGRLQWRPCCEPWPSIEMIRQTCQSYNGPGIIVSQ